MNKWIKRVLGEAAPEMDVAAPESASMPPPATPAPEVEDTDADLVNEPSERVNPTIDTMVKAWQSGSKTAVAARILDAMDSYADFVQLCFAIGQDGASELGHTMDELTSDEHSPRELAGEELPPDGQSQGQRKLLKRDELPEAPPV